MDANTYKKYIDILNEELVMALGCTEPIAVSYASALAKKELGKLPEKITVYASGNIIKNVKGVTVPNSGGQKGLEAAAILGALGGNADKVLEVLTEITPLHIKESRRLAAEKLCHVKLVEGVANLYIRVEMESGDENSLVEISGKHTNVTKIEKNGIRKEGFVSQIYTDEQKKDREFMSVESILNFADALDPHDVTSLLGNQIRCNLAIAEEGLNNKYGVNVGRNHLRLYDAEDVKTKAVAYAAAGSDARMSGCDLPVVINSGSGNQGITVSMPVYQYWEKSGADEDMLYRALAVSNLISIHIKSGIGSLSAFCGAVSAATGAGAAIAYLNGLSRDVIKMTIVNTLGSIAGMVCDGAKASCAAKIADAVSSAIRSVYMAENGDYFGSDEGIIGENVETTIKNVCRMGRVGMSGTDLEVLHIMIGE